MNLIISRNVTRRDAGLPCLDVAVELKKLEAIGFEATFEREIERNRPRLRHVWADKKMRGLSRMGLWNKARAELRDEMSQCVVGEH
jgi:hypothetical protein